MATRVTLNLPRSLWSAQDTARLAANTLAAVKLRTSQGIDANGKPFDGYSTTSIYVAKKGARLSPKGGRPSRTGKSIFYAGGYQQYKRDSRRRGGAGDSAEVDLVLSGNMLNNFVILEATANRFRLGLTQNAQYGYFVNAEREFIGLTDDDVNVLVQAVTLDIQRKLK